MKLEPVDPLSLRVDIEQWPMKMPLRIAGYTFNVVEVLVVSLGRDGHFGRGEAHGVFYKGETPASISRQIELVRSVIETGISRDSLQDVLAPGGARNAVDCALWDLEAKCSGKSIWELTGIAPKPVTTVFTIGIEDNPAAMAARALDASMYSILKIKVDKDQPVERVAAIRAARPDAILTIDANQGWTFEQLREFAPRLAKMDVKLIEQPLPRGSDALLDGYTSPVPLSADESCQHRGELEQVARRYQIVNIKLDKAGGLTEALLLAEAVRVAGLYLLVGCMNGTSLSMAPGYVLAQLCKFVELDGHLLLQRDRSPSLSCRKGEIDALDPRLWG